MTNKPVSRCARAQTTSPSGHAHNQLRPTRVTSNSSRRSLGPIEAVAAVRRWHPVDPQSISGRPAREPMHTAMRGRTTSGDTLAAREVAARNALWRLRNCSRDIERLASRARAAGRDSLSEQVRQRVGAFTIEAARIRVELRRWDVGSSLWIALLEARLDRLAAEIGLTAENAPG